jgi:hypothetical protein
MNTPISNTSIPSNVSSTTVSTTLAAHVTPGTATISTSAIAASSVYASNIKSPYYMGNISGAYTPGNNSVSFYDNKHNVIVTLTYDGEVVWADGINVDEAAEAFARAIHLGAEISANIRENVKCKIRNTVLEDLISTAKEEGPLDEEKLKSILTGFKIVDSLRGVK